MSHPPLDPPRILKVHDEDAFRAVYHESHPPLDPPRILKVYVSDAYSIDTPRLTHHSIRRGY